MRNVLLTFGALIGAVSLAACGEDPAKTEFWSRQRCDEGPMPRAGDSSLAWDQWFIRSTAGTLKVDLPALVCPGEARTSDQVRAVHAYADELRRSVR
jgi:hypothetical protein